MTAFEYRAVDKQGRTRQGVIAADSAVAARRNLRQLNLSPIHIAAETHGKQKKQARQSSLNNTQRILMTRQLALMIGAGTPIEEALSMIGRHSKKQNMRLILARVRAAVNEGKSLGRALEAEGKNFPPLYCVAVSAGENSGTLEKVLEELSQYLEKNAAGQQKLLSVMAYPIILTIVAISVAAALLILVVPQLSLQLSGMGQELPALTRFMLSLSDMLQRYGLFLLAGISLLLLASSKLMQMKTVKRKRDRWLLRLPVFGSLLRDTETARFCRGMAALICGGAPVVEAVMAARASLRLVPLQDASNKMLQQLREGVALSSSMMQTEAFPPLAVYMVRGGEAGGELDAALERASQYMEERVESTSNLLLALLEPAITLLMAGMVLLIILSVMLPILQLNSAILG